MKQTVKKSNLIICPNCGREYMPAEIFLPKEFFGRPLDILRTSNGQIDVFDGTPMNPKETYNCDNCFKTFKVKAKISFDTEIDEKNNMDEPYREPIYKTKLYLKED